MGYEADDLEHLHYQLLPQMAPLDGQPGGEAVAALAEVANAAVVIIDTFGRAVVGRRERRRHRPGLVPLDGPAAEARSRAFIRIDHAGKDLDRGQRGSSAKNDDVDVVWQMTELDARRYRLTAVKRRLEAIPEIVEIDKVTDEVGLTYRLMVGDIGYPAGTAKVADDLDRLGVALDASRRLASDTLRDHGCGARHGVVTAALRYRRERALRVVPEGRGPRLGDRTPGSSGDQPADLAESAGQTPDGGPRDHGGPLSDPDGDQGWSPVGGPPVPGSTFPGLFEDPPDLDRGSA